MDITFSSAAEASLEEARKMTNAKSKHQVVQEALMVYFALLDHKDEKNGIIIVDERSGKRFRLTLYPER